MSASGPARSSGAPPFPGPFQASLLALLGVFLASLVAVSFEEAVSPTAAAGLATVLGLGGAGLLGATHVPPPHAERLGLRGLRLAHLLALVLLVPVAVLATEIEPLLARWLPAPDAALQAERLREVLPTDERLALVETLIVTVGLAPVVEEWLFRGVIQQGLVAHMGARAGVLVTALLFALAHGGAGRSAESWLLVVAQMLALGLAFGFARAVTRSLFAAILLHAGVNALGVASLALTGGPAVPGAPVAHVPAALLAGSALSVVLGAWWLRRLEPVPLRPEPPARDAGRP